MKDSFGSLEDMLVIGLTGGIGTGKTEVAGILRALGAEIISADEVGHEVYMRGTEGWREVVEAFGEEFLAPNGEVDRAKLGGSVFGDELTLRRLNAIVHSRMRTMMDERIRELEAEGAHVAVLEAAILLEAGWAALADEVWVTVAPEDQVIDRLRGRGGLDGDAIRARVQSQMSQTDRLAHADAVIDNSGTREELRGRVQALWQQRVSQNRKRQDQI